MRYVGLVLVLVLVAGCAAGPGGQWQQEGAEAAGFFAGLWHGILLVITLIVSFFTDQVGIYELNNSGTAYDIGFVLGVLAVYGSGFSITVRRKRKPADEFGERIERKVKAKIEALLESEEDWEELGEKVERKIKEKLRRWLDEDRS